ncbi:hypothetical protein TSMEX_000284 [Taenia solium]|eukprot:TsM_001004200 transcript=TsM_001004200 gene=TsM_001004200
MSIRRLRRSVLVCFSKSEPESLSSMMTVTWFDLVSKMAMATGMFDDGLLEDFPYALARESKMFEIIPMCIHIDVNQCNLLAYLVLYNSAYIVPIPASM